MPPVAFALRPLDDEGYAATVVLQPDGATLYVHEMLEAGGGVIVTDDVQEIEALRYVPELEEVPPPEEVDPARLGRDSLNRRALAAGVDGPEKLKTKQDVIDAIAEAQAPAPVEAPASTDDEASAGEGGDES